MNIVNEGLRQIADVDYTNWPDEIKIPGLSRRVNGRTKVVTLKDGTRVTIRFSVVEDRCVKVSALMDDHVVGHMTLYPNRVPPPDADFDLYADDRGSFSATTVSVEAEFRRRGIASAMYDSAARFGLRIIPSGRYGGKLSHEGAALWDSQKRFLRNKIKRPRFWTPKK